MATTDDQNRIDAEAKAIAAALAAEDAQNPKKDKKPRGKTNGDPSAPRRPSSIVARLIAKRAELETILAAMSVHDIAEGVGITLRAKIDLIDEVMDDE
jgi:hypothetical protein